MVLLSHTHVARVTVLGARRSRHLARGAEALRMHHVIERKHAMIMKGPVGVRHRARIRIAHREPGRQAEHNQNGEFVQLAPCNDLRVLGAQRG